MKNPLLTPILQPLPKQDSVEPEEPKKAKKKRQEPVQEELSVNAVRAIDMTIAMMEREGANPDFIEWVRVFLCEMWSRAKGVGDIGQIMGVSFKAVATARQERREQIVEARHHRLEDDRGE